MQTICEALVPVAICYSVPRSPVRIIVLPLGQLCRNTQRRPPIACHYVTVGVERVGAHRRGLLAPGPEFSRTPGSFPRAAPIRQASADAFFLPVRAPGRGIWPLWGLDCPPPPAEFAPQGRGFR